MAKLLSCSRYETEWNENISKESAQCFTSLEAYVGTCDRRTLKKYLQRNCNIQSQPSARNLSAESDKSVNTSPLFGQ